MNTEKGNIFHHLDIKMMFDDSEWKSLLAGVDLDIMNQRQKRKRIMTTQVVVQRANDKRRK